MKLLLSLLLLLSVENLLAKPIKNGKARLKSCDSHNVGICEIDLVVSKKKMRRIIQKTLTLFLKKKGRKVFKIRKYKISRVNLSSNGVARIKIVAKGKWFISRRQILNQLRSRRSLRLSYKRKFDAGRRQPPILINSLGHSFEEPSEDKGFEGFSEGEEDYFQAEPVASRPSPVQLTAKDAELSPFYHSLSDWAQGNGSDKDVAALFLKAGSANSPTGHMGVGLEFYLVPAIPLTLGFGTYDSNRYLDKSYGRIKYKNVSLGSGILIGNKASKLKAQVGLTQIIEHRKVADPQYLNQQQGIQSGGTRDYFGYHGTLGVRFAVTENLLLDIDYGFFNGPRNYEKSFGAPIKRGFENTGLSAAKKKDSYTMGLGTTF